MYSSEEEMQQYLVEQGVVGKKGAESLECGSKLLNGDLSILEEEKPEALSETDLENLTDPEYFVENFGPVVAREFPGVSSPTKEVRRSQNLELFELRSTQGTNENSFTPGETYGVFYSSSERPERILEAFADANNLELGPENEDGSSWAMLHSLPRSFRSDEANNWLKYRDPAGWALQYISGDFDLRERIKDRDYTPAQLAKELDSSEHFAEEAINWFNQD